MTRNHIAALTLLLLGSTVLSACARTAPSTSPSSSPEVVHVAPPTGERETDRASIPAALDQVRPGGTVQFAPGRYLVGRMIRIDTPGITLLGHSEGTVLRGCELDEYEAMELDFVAAFERDGFDVDPGILGRCGQFHLTGGNVTVRSLTFEQSRLGLVLGCCEDERVLRSFAGGYRIEENHFRNTGNSIRAWVQAEEPTVIRGNEFTNTFHALSASGSRIHFVDNRVAAPGDATQQITDLEGELEAIVEEFRGDNDRFGVLFASFDGDGSAVHVSGDIRPDDHLRLGSVSKVFLGFMVLRKELSPDATIEPYYPADRYPQADAITARMLLNHTSGIPDEMGRRMREFAPRADPAEVLRALQPILAAPAARPDERIAAIYNHDVGLDFAPGTLWCYSNPGYVMLGRMLERSTGQPIERLLARHFGEVAPSLYLDDGRDANFPDSYPHPWPIHWSQPWVAGALIATAADAVAAFHHISQQPEFQMMQEWMTLPRCPADIVFGDDYGLALQRYVFDGIGDGIGHDGHIIARSLLFQLGGTSYLIHTTRSVGNPELRAIAQRLLATQR